MTDLSDDLLTDRFVQPDDKRRNKVAAEIDELCSPTMHPENLKHFREHIERCRQKELRYERWQNDLERQENERRQRVAKKYAMQFELTKKDLRYGGPEAREQGPPGPEHEWIDFHFWEQDGRVRHISGWVIVDDEDDFKVPDFPPPPSPFRNIFAENNPRPHTAEDLLGGYYWTLAVIHDRMRGDRFRIIEDDLKALVNSGTPPDEWQWPAGMAVEMAAFPDMIGERFTCDEVRIAMMEVEADLEKAQRGAAPILDKPTGMVETDSIATQANPVNVPQARPEPVHDEQLVTIDRIVVKEPGVHTNKAIQNRDARAKKNPDDPWNHVVVFNEYGKVLGYRLSGLPEYHAATKGSPKLMTEAERHDRHESVRQSSINPVKRPMGPVCGECGKGGSGLLIAKFIIGREEKPDTRALCQNCYNALPPEYKLAFDENRLREDKSTS